MDISFCRDLIKYLDDPSYDEEEMDQELSHANEAKTRKIEQRLTNRLKGFLHIEV